jgi:hypothetical protein
VRVEFQLLTELELQNRGIEGTDAAMVVAVDGRQIGYTDDYGTFTAFDAREALPVDLIQLAAEAVGDMYEATDAYGAVR